MIPARTAPVPPFAPAAARRRPTLGLALLGLALLAGCASRHSIEVGSIPDDYRTRHPIVVDEDMKLLELPVTSAGARLPQSDVGRVADFGRQFRASRAATVRVLVPEGSANASAARLASRDAVAALKREGVPASRILVQPYRADALEGAVPIRLSYSALAARTGPCGRWPDQLADTEQNRNYHNFGCASQQNLAAQVADPSDLLGPRGQSEIDAARRTNMLEDYRLGANTASERPRTESNYSW
jgi:pilus assembly protein CpaD